MYDEIKEYLVAVKDYIDLLFEVNEVDEKHHRKAIIKIVIIAAKFCLL